MDAHHAGDLALALGGVVGWLLVVALLVGKSTVAQAAERISRQFVEERDAQRRADAARDVALSLERARLDVLVRGRVSTPGLRQMPDPHAGLRIVSKRGA